MAQFKEFFENPAYRTDGLKLYPTLVIRGTGLYELWKTGQYKNYTPNALVDIVARIMALVPPWTRVYRVQRDIPMPLVSSGVENGNLRELALGRVKDFGAECRDVRYREVGVRRDHHLFSIPLAANLLADEGSCRDSFQIQEIHNKVRPFHLDLIRRDYVANGPFYLSVLLSAAPADWPVNLAGGWETFLSYEDAEQDVLVGLLRLRKCSEEGTFRKELINGPDGMGASVVRELVRLGLPRLALAYVV